jgi:hypothetical protein
MPRPAAARIPEEEERLAEPLPWEEDPEFLAGLDEALDEVERGEMLDFDEMMAQLRAKRQ